MNEIVLSTEEINALKKKGYLNNRGTQCFSARVVAGNGTVSSMQMRAVADAADKYAKGTVAFTTRLTMEVPGIPYENIEAFEKDILAAGLYVGGTGPLVRPVVSCKGTVCRYGLIDTFALSKEIHERFYLGWHQTELPHKFKIAVGGCPNSCVKPDLNDIGIQGAIIPETKEHGYKVMIGGRWGKKKVQGRSLSKVLTSKEEVLELIERALTLFKEQGLPKERFADTIERLGFEEVERILLP